MGKAIVAAAFAVAWLLSGCGGGGGGEETPASAAAALNSTAGAPATAQSVGFTYPFLAGSTNTWLTAWISQPYAGPLPVTSATTAGNVTLDDFEVVEPALPAGLSIDPHTGQISGTARALTPNSDYRLRAKLAVNAATTTVDGTLSLKIGRPFQYAYPPYRTIGSKGTFVQFAPSIIQLSRVGPGALSTRWKPDPLNSCSLPSGVAIDAATGTISGTPSQSGSYSCWVQVTITNDGISWPSTTLAAFQIK